MLRIHATVILLLSCLVPALSFSASQPALDKTVFGSDESNCMTVLHVPALGRYAIISQSSTAASLELVDRMAGVIGAAGPLSGAGSTGSVSRLDQFLEPGDYKLNITKKDADTVTLSARRFTTVNAGPDESAPPILADRQSLSTELKDLQLLSYWLKIEPGTTSLLLEARGRSLTDAVLWKDGLWLVPVRPVRRALETEPGKPLTVIEFNAPIEPGNYLLVCAGGPRLAWARESDTEVFSITRGAAYLGDVGTMRLTIGERGTESFLVSGRVFAVQMEVPNAKTYKLMGSVNTPGGSRYEAARVAVLDEKSITRRCSVQALGGGQSNWITVQGPPGETVELRWLTMEGAGGAGGAVYLQPYPQSGTYQTTILSGLDGRETVDLTSLLLQVDRSQKKPNLDVKASQVLSFSAESPLRRQVNLLNAASFLLLPKSRGTYGVVEKDPKTASGRYQFRLLDDWITGGAPGVEVKPGGRVDLLEKLYVVYIQPVKPGILDFALVPTNFLGRARPGDIFDAPAPAPVDEQFWPSQDITQGGATQNLLLLGSRGSVPVGVQVRKLPLDIEQTACVRVEPSQTLSLPLFTRRPLTLYSTNPAFSPGSVRVDGAPWQPDQILTPGGHSLAITNRTERPEWHVIGGAVPDLTAVGPRPAVIDPAVQFPSFSEGSPSWRSFDRNQTASFLLKVSEPASYRLTTTGRLAMGITVRTFLNPSLLSVSQNSDGRNASVTTYLRPGTYLVQVASQGASRGRAGVALERLPLVSAGSMAVGGTLRATVPAGSLMAAELRLERTADCSLECLGLGRGFAYRLEDADGWPIGQPVQSGTLFRRLPAGSYRYLSLADQVETRRVLTLSEMLPARGYDPKARRVELTPNRSYQKVWVEEPGRPADIFTVELPSEIRAVFSLSRGMSYRIQSAAGDPGYQGVGGKALSLTLAKGTWKIAVSSLEEDNLRQYELTLSTEDMFLGTSRLLAALPVLVPVSIGSTGSAELWSYGANEVEAALFDEAGNMVALGQTIPDDWNFRIVAPVKPGRYQLFVYSPLAGPASAPVQEPPRAQAQRGQPAQEDYEGDYAEEGYGDEEGYPQDEQPMDYEEEPPARAAVPAAVSLSQGSSQLFMILRGEKPLAAAAARLDAAVELGNEVAVVPFTPSESGVHRFSGQAAGPVSVSILKGGRPLASGQSPLFLPLAAGTAYTLRYWRTTDTPSAVRLTAAAERSVEAGTASTQQVQANALRVSLPPASSVRLESDAGPLLFSAGTELPFLAVTDAAVSAAAGTGWAVRPDGGAMGMCRITPVVFSDAGALPLSVGAVDGGFGLQVPARTVALVRTDNAGRPVGLSISRPDAPRPESHDWKGARVDSRSSVVGVRDGTWRGRLWETEPASEGPGGNAPGESSRRIIVSAEMFPVASESPLGGIEKSLSVAPRTAIAFTLAGRQAVRVSLEKGMAAFAWVDGAAGIVDARDSAATESLDAGSGTVYVVNRGTAAAFCTLRPGLSAPLPEVGEGDGFEALLAADAAVSFAVRPAAGSRLYLWGQVKSVRFLSQESGFISSGERLTAELPGVLAFPAGKGRLEVTSAGGPLRVWTAGRDALGSAFASRDARLKDAPLPPEGGALAATAQAWSFTLERQAVACVRADGDGVAALFDASGACLRVTAGTSGRILLARLPKGSYTVYTRPFRGASPPAGGLVSVRSLTPTALEADGPGQPALIGPQDVALYSFRTAEAGRVGCGIRVQSDLLSASLFDERFSLLDTGSIFVRTLKAGQYYLLVTSTADTQRYTPVVFGLDNRMQVPDDVVRSYRGE
jgi:hypothetical protein